MGLRFFRKGWLIDMNIFEAFAAMDRGEKVVRKLKRGISVSPPIYYKDGSRIFVECEGFALAGPVNDLKDINEDNHVWEVYKEPKLNQGKTPCVKEKPYMTLQEAIHAMKRGCHVKPAGDARVIFFMKNKVIRWVREENFAVYSLSFADGTTERVKDRLMFSYNEWEIYWDPTLGGVPAEALPCKNDDETAYDKAVRNNHMLQIEIRALTSERDHYAAHAQNANKWMGKFDELKKEYEELKGVVEKYKTYPWAKRIEELEAENEKLLIRTNEIPPKYISIGAGIMTISDYIDCLREQLDELRRNAKQAAEILTRTFDRC
jgi:hypothetical protein